MKALGIIWELSVYVLGPELTKVGRGDEMSNESGFQLAGTGPESYERYIGVFMAPFVDAVIQRAKLTRGGAVLDVACGTGFVARAASSLVGSTGRVAGLDINPGMLEVARAASASANPSIEWHQASAEEIPFEDATFDAVLCSQGIMFLPDLRNGVKELCRVAAPGGRVVASFWASLERSIYIAASIGRMEKALPEGSMGVIGQAFRLDRDETAAIFRDSGLKGVVAETVEEMVSLPPIADYLPGHAASLPYAGEFEALDPAVRQRLYDEITDDLAAYIQGDGTVLVPFAVHMVSGIRQ